MHNSTETRKALMPGELLLRSIQNGFPMVLLLGQDAWSTKTHPDAILELALARLERPSSIEKGWPGLIDGKDLPDGYHVWLAERFLRRQIPPWMTSLAVVPWSAIYTSSLDPTLTQAFSSAWREPQAILTSSEVPVVGRSTARTPLYYLFGRAGISDPQAMAPHNRQTLRIRQNVHAVPMLNRLAETTTPVGLLVIDGVTLGRDWLASDALLTTIEQLPTGQVLWCGFDREASIPPDYVELIDRGHVVATSMRLSMLIAELQTSGRLDDLSQIQVSDQVGEITLATQQNSVTIFSPPPELRIRVEASAAIVDDSWTSFQAPLGSETSYATFRRFHGDVEGPRALVSGVRRGFAIVRDFERQILSKVEDAIANHARFPDPIVVHGQSGTGKSIALAHLVARLREKHRVPVLYAVTRIPAGTDVERFCDEVEKHGASVTVIVCDNNAPVSRYRDLLFGLRSRGRRVVLVCSTYRQIDLAEPVPEYLVEAPDALSEGERNALASLVNRLNPGGTKLVSGTDRHILLALYHLLPASRMRLSSGLGKETRVTEEEIRQRARSPLPAQKAETRMGQQLLSAGFQATNTQILLSKIDDALQGLDDDAGRLINLVMVPGQLGCAVPIDVLIRALNSGKKPIGLDVIAYMFRGIDLFRWRTGQGSEDLLVAPRLSFEAEIICERRMLGARNEGTYLVELVKATRLGWDAGGTERRFLLDLLQRMGPDGSRSDRYTESYLDVARALTELRITFGVLDPSLMLQESVFRRSAIRKEMVSPEFRLGILEEARSAVQAALDHLEAQRSNTAVRTRANLLVERATIFGFLATHQASMSSGVDAVWSSYLAARTAARTAIGVSETYFPLDVSLWIPADLLERVELPEKLRLELTADIYSVLDRVEPTAFPIEQQVKYSTRRYRLGQVLSDSAMSDAAFEQLAKDGSTVGYYLQARSVGPLLGAEASDVIVDDDKRKAEDAVTFLTKHWDAIRNDERCLRYYLQCRWMLAVGQRLFRNQRGALPFYETDRRDILRIVETINSLASLGADNSLLYLRAVLAWLVDEERSALDTWMDLARETDFLDPRRPYRRHIITNADQTPLVFSGRIESDNDPYTIRVTEMNRRIKLLNRDFPGLDLGYGRQVSGFSIAFNYIGPIADPPQSKGRR
jgi:hypothetical protein